MTTILANIGDKKQNIKDMRIVVHAGINTSTGDEVDTVEYVEYTVVGNKSEWIDWTPLNEFMNANPGVDI